MTGRDYAGPADLPRMELLLRGCEPEASYDFHVHDLRRGLARALVLTALRGLRDRGCERALLGVDGANTAAIKLYESCGYHTLYRKAGYSRQFEPE